MIIKDLRNLNNDLNQKKETILNEKDMSKVRELTKEDIINIILEKDSEILNWDVLGDYIKNGIVDVSKIDLSDLVEEVNYRFPLLDFFIDYLRKTDEQLLYNCNTTKVTKDMFSKLLCLDYHKKELDYIKTLANRVDNIDEMYFYDFSENNFSEEETVEIISKKLNISIDSLYPCYPYTLFKNEYFNPTLITNLTSECGLDVEDYENFEFNVILI